MARLGCTLHVTWLYVTCNVQPSQATANPVDGKACSSTKSGLLRFIPNTYSIHKVSSLKFAYFQGKLSRYITSSSERTRPESWPGTTWVRQPRSGGCHHPTAATKCNERPSRATANPVDGKACSSTKGGLLRYIPNTYSIHKVSSLIFAYFQGKLSRYMIKMYRYEFFTVFDLISALVPKIAHPDRFRKTCAARLAHSSTGVWISYIKFTR